MNCPQCGKPAPSPDAKFCAQCGAPFSLPVVSSPPPAPTARKKGATTTPIVVAAVVVALLAILCCCCLSVAGGGLAFLYTPPLTTTPIVASTRPPARTATPQARLKVGLVTDAGKIDDKSFNEAAWNALLQAERELGAEIAYIESRDPKDYDKNIATLIDGGCNVVVTTGFILNEATAKAARQHPRVMFIGTDQFLEETLPNHAGLIFEEDEGGFLAGALAALVSESGVVGAVLGSDIVPPVVRFGQGYEAGARYVDPDITVILTYHPGDLGLAFVDPAWGKQTALQQIDQKADVIFGAGGTTGNGAIAAAAEKGVYCIGVDMDQWYTLPETRPYLLSSAMKLITPGTFELIEAAQKGTFQGGNVLGDMGLAPFHDTEDQVPAEVKRKLDEIDKGLRDGSIRTGVEL